MESKKDKSKRVTVEKLIVGKSAAGVINKMASPPKFQGGRKKKTTATVIPDSPFFKTTADLEDFLIACLDLDNLTPHWTKS